MIDRQGMRFCRTKARPLIVLGLVSLGMLTAQADTVYVSFSGNSNTIGTFNSNQGPGDSVFGTYPNANLNYANGIAFDTTGKLYVANSNNGTITRFDSQHNASPFASGVTLFSPSALAFDQNGNLYVSNSNGTIKKITPSGVGTTFATITGIPTGLAFDTKGNLYVADYINSQIVKITPAGDKTLFADNGGYTTLNRPVGLAFDAQGNLYAANSDSSLNTVRKFTSIGDDLGVFASAGLANPNGLAFDSNGNLFVANFHHTQVGAQYEGSGYSTIVEFSSAGGLVNTFYDSTYGPSNGLHDAGYIAITNNAGQPLIQPTPEPSTGLLLAMGAACLGLRPSRSRRKT